MLTDHAGRLAGIELADGHRIDAVVVGPRFRARAEAFAPLGLRPAAHATGLGDVIEIDPKGETSVPGLYAAGNATDPSHQVSAAAAHGSRIGAMICFDLAHEDLLAASQPSATEADWDHRYSGDALWSGNPNGTLVHEVAAMPPGRALDVGAGEGGDALWLAEQGWKVTASDISRRVLDRVAAQAERRGLLVECRHADANALEPFEHAAFDLVSAQYASIPRTPDARGVHNLLDAVAPGGTLLVVGHDHEPMRAHTDPQHGGHGGHVFDPDAYVQTDDFVTAIAGSPAWNIEVNKKRTRPPGAASAAHHIDDVVLRADASAEALRVSADP